MERRRTQIRWDRLGRWALIAVLGLVLYLYIGPAASWVSAYREAGRKRAEVAALKAENARLRKSRRELKDPAALEREARRLGMVKAGEKSYVIEGLPRRRLGGAFTSDELAELYEHGTDWATDLAVAVAPEDPYAWDARTVADAAFGRYLRGASDFAGGRRLPID